MVSFNRIPSNFLLPLAWIEFDGSQMGTPQSIGRALVIGTMRAQGSATPGVLVPIGSADTAAGLFGAGAQIGAQVRAFRRNNLVQELFALPVLEPADGTAATGSIVVTGPATAAGTIALYIDDDRPLRVGVVPQESAASIATKIAAAISAATQLPVSASAEAGTVTLTAKWKGLTGNDIPVFVNYRGAVAGEALPDGVTLTITAMSGGAGVPDVAAALDAIGEEPFETIASAFADDASLDVYDEVWGDGDEGRWGWLLQLYGHVYTARRAGYADHIAHGATRNGPHVTVFRLEADFPNSPWISAAGSVGQILRSVVNDPARPLHTLPVVGLLSPRPESRFGVTERNALASNGGATLAVSAGTVQIEAPVTTYRLNAFGLPDNGLRFVEPLHTVAAVLRRLRLAITTKYGRHKLANNGVRVPPGRAIVTPNTIRAELVVEYERLEEEEGLVENSRAFKENLVVERDTSNPDRVNVLYPPDVINQLRVLAVLAQPRLQSQNATA
ncbi:phage tail sheath C-terminal domain-containing protein [Salinarimonas sp.]|uniref:phage tail sheath C-terminal domain-containing protein n=1 Tax=Salinarimonas sp. TaxID=2766526 RepID=UPI00391A6D81